MGNSGEVFTKFILLMKNMNWTYYSTDVILTTSNRALMKKDYFKEGKNE